MIIKLKRKPYVLLLLAVFLLWLNASVRAQPLNIDIVGGLKTAIPIVVVPFARPGGMTLPTDITAVMSHDFNRSGTFRALARRAIIQRPWQGSQIQFTTWRLLKQDYIVIGRITRSGVGKVQVEYGLWDVNKQKNLLHQRMSPTPLGDLRNLAHQMADLIYQKINGVRGAFWTRIAYITAVEVGHHTRYSLIVADSDGYNPKVVARSHQALLSPHWSPDGKKIAYVSFESGNSAIYIQDLKTGRRTLVSGRKGINSAPTWSPDGTRLAMSLSYSGNPEIYVINLASRRETRLTHSLSINTEPAWSPDGKYLYFTSDRSGKPQIYRMSTTGGTPVRLTFQGQSNYDCDVGRKGRQMALVQGNDNIFRIGIMNLDPEGQVRYLSPGPLDESPSFAPNGSMLMYASNDGRHGVLYAVSSDGKIRQRLAFADGDVRQPSWGPYR